jgi:hypothetical protein
MALSVSIDNLLATFQAVAGLHLCYLNKCISYARVDHFPAHSYNKPKLQDELLERYSQAAGPHNIGRKNRCATYTAGERQGCQT